MTSANQLDELTRKEEDNLSIYKWFYRNANFEPRGASKISPVGLSCGNVITFLARTIYGIYFQNSMELQRVRISESNDPTCPITIEENIQYVGDFTTACCIGDYVVAYDKDKGLQLWAEDVDCINVIRENIVSISGYDIDDFYITDRLKVYNVIKDEYEFRDMVKYEARKGDVIQDIWVRANTMILLIHRRSSAKQISTNIGSEKKTIINDSVITEGAPKDDKNSAMGIGNFFDKETKPSQFKPMEEEKSDSNLDKKPEEVLPIQKDDSLKEPELNFKDSEFFDPRDSVGNSNIGEQSSFGFQHSNTYILPEYRFEIIPLTDLHKSVNEQNKKFINIQAVHAWYPKPKPENIKDVDINISRKNYPIFSTAFLDKNAENFYVATKDGDVHKYSLADTEFTLTGVHRGPKITFGSLHEGEISVLNFNKMENLMITSGTEDNKILVINPQTQEILNTFEDAYGSKITALEFTDIDQTIIGSDMLKTVAFHSRCGSKVMKNMKAIGNDSSEQKWHEHISEMRIFQFVPEPKPDGWRPDTEGNDIEIFYHDTDTKRILRKWDNGKSECTELVIDVQSHIDELNESDYTTCFAISDNKEWISVGTENGSVLWFKQKSLINTGNQRTVISQPYKFERFKFSRNSFDDNICVLKWHPNNNCCIGVSRYSYKMKLYEMDQVEFFESQKNKNSNKTPNQSKESGKNQPNLNQNDEQCDANDDYDEDAGLNETEDYLCCYTGVTEMQAYSLEISHDGLYIAYGSYRTVYVCSFFDPEEIIHKFENMHQDDVVKLGFSIDDKKLWTASTDQKIKYANLETKEVLLDKDLEDLLTGEVGVYSMALNYDEKIIAFGDAVANQHIVNLETLKKEFQFHNEEEFHRYKINEVHFHPTNKRIQFTGGEDGMINKIMINDQVNLLSLERPHNSCVNSVCMTPNGRLILSCSDDGDIKLFDRDSKKMLYHQENAHDGDQVKSLHCTKNNKFYTGGKRGAVKVWEIRSNSEIHHYTTLKMNGGQGQVQCIKKSPERISEKVKFIAVSKLKTNLRNTQNSLVIYNSKDLDEDSKEFEKLDCGTIFDMCWSKEGRLLIIGTQTSGMKILDVENYAQLFTFKSVFSDEVFSINISPNDEFLICGGATDMKIFDFHKRQEIFEKKDCHKGKISSIAISNDSKYLATCSSDKNVMLFDIANKTVIQFFEQVHYDEILQIFFSPDQQSLLTCSKDISIKVFDIGSNIVEKQFKNLFYENETISLDINSDDEYLAAGSSMGEIKQISLGQNKTVVDQYKDMNDGDQIFCLKFSGDILASASNYHIDFLNWKKKRKLFSYQYAHQYHISSLVFNRSQKLMASGSWDGTVCLFDTSNYETEEEKKKKKGGLFGGLMGGGGDAEKKEEEKVDQTDCAGNEYPVRMIRQYGSVFEYNRVESCCFHPQKNLLVVCGNSDDSTIKVIDCDENVEENQKQVDKEMEEDVEEDSEPPKLTLEQQGYKYNLLKKVHMHLVTTIAFNPDGGILATGSQDKTIKLVDFGQIEESDGENVNIIKTFDTGHSDIQLVRISPKYGEYLSAVDTLNNLYVYDLEKKELLFKQMEIHESEITGLTFSNNEKYIATCSQLSLKLIGLDNYFNEGEVMMKLDEKTAPPPWTIKYQNPLKGYSFLTYKIWQEFILKGEARKKDISNYIATNQDNVASAFGDILSYPITDVDVCAILSALCHLQLHIFLPNILKSISTNVNRPEFEDHYPQIVDMINDNRVENKGLCIHHLFVALFKEVEDMNWATTQMIDSKHITYIAEEINFKENANARRAFGLRDKDIHKLLIPCKTFRTTFDVNFAVPSQKLYDLFKLLNEHGANETFSDDNVYNMVEAYWSSYQFQLLCYFTVYCLVVILLMFQAWWLNADFYVVSRATENAVNWLIISITFILTIYELLQLCATGMNYITSFGNIIDLVTFALIYTNSIHQLTVVGEEKYSVDHVSLYVCAFFLAFVKLYRGLNIIDFIRSLTSKLVTIIQEISNFLIIMVVCILCFSMIFYASKFYDGEDGQKDTRNYWLYILYTYDMMFGSWNTMSPADPNLEWIIVYFLIYTILFPIVLFNLLVALITDAYNDTKLTERSDNTKCKLEYILEVIELRRLINRWFQKKEKNENKDIDFRHIQQESSMLTLNREFKKSQTLERKAETEKKMTNNLISKLSESIALKKTVKEEQEEIEKKTQHNFLYIMTDNSEEVNKISKDPIEENCKNLKDDYSQRQYRLEDIREQIKGLNEKVIKTEKIDMQLNEFGKTLDKLEALEKSLNC